MRIQLVLGVCALLGCAAAPPRTPAPPAAPTAVSPAIPPAAAPIRLTIAATNDVHGWLMPHEEVRKDGVVVAVGGVEVLAGYLAILRAREPGGVILVDGGDLFQGTLASNLTEGASVVEAYNALGYDAAALGNHEFDFGPVGPQIVARAPGDDPLGALKARVSEARFPFLAANVTDRATGKPPPWIKPSTIVERRGVKVGILGLATPDTPAVTVAANVQGLVFEDPVTATVREAAALRAAGAEVIVILAHIGGRCDAPAPKDCEGELFRLLGALPPGTVDAAVGGHTHRVLATELGGVPVIESGALGKAFGTIELTLDPVSHRPLAGKSSWRAGIELCRQHAAPTDRCDPSRGGPQGKLAAAAYLGAPVAPDPAIEALVKPHLDRVAAAKLRPLRASLKQPLTRDYDGESEVGNLVADAIRARVPGADLAVTNSGGLRSDLPAGALNFGHVFQVVPFDNRLAVVSVTGAELQELVRIGFTGTHGGLQLSGATVKLDLRRPGACATRDADGDGQVTPYDRERVAELRVGGEPVDPARTYRVATNDFLAGGGSGWDKLLRKLPPGRVKVLDDAPILRDTLVEFVEGKGELAVAPPGNRVIVSGTLPRCDPGR